MNMGGFAVDPDGTTRVIDQFKISHDFDAGESVTFPGVGKLFAEWQLIEGSATNPWPLVYAAGVAMAEKDQGGFWQFLHDLWKLVADKVIALIVAGVGAGIGGAIGGVIGAAVGFVVGGLVGLIIGLFDDPDDILGTHHFELWLGSALGSYYDWAGLTKSPPDKFTTDFTGDGGHYRAAFYYRVSA